MSAGSRRSHTHSAEGSRAAPDLTSSGDVEVEPVGSVRGSKRKSRGPGTPTVDEDEELVAAAAAAHAAPPGGAVGRAAAGRQTQGTSPVAEMGPFLRGEVLAVRADPEDKAPFWVCAVHGTRKAELEATWCARNNCVWSFAPWLAHVGVNCAVSLAQVRDCWRQGDGAWRAYEAAAYVARPSLG